MKQLPGTLWIWRERKGSGGEAAESVDGEASAGDGEGGAGRARQDAGTKAEHWQVTQERLTSRKVCYSHGDR